MIIFETVNQMSPKKICKILEFDLADCESFAIFVRPQDSKLGICGWRSAFGFFSGMCDDQLADHVENWDEEMSDDGKNLFLTDGYENTINFVKTPWEGNFFLTRK